MKKKASAYQEYNEAAMMDMLMQSLPKMAHEISTPMSKTKKITMVTANGETGAAKLTGEVLEIMTKMPELVKSLTGVDVAKVLLQTYIEK